MGQPGADGAFYGLAGDAAPPRLAWANFGLSNLGNLMALPMVAMIQAGKPPVVPVLLGGEVAIVAGMLLFGAAIVTVAQAAPPPATATRKPSVAKAA